MSGRCDAALAEFPRGAVNESGVCSPASSEPTYRQQVLSSAKCDGGVLKRIESGTATCRGSEQGPSVGHVGASCVLSPADALLNPASEPMSMGSPVHIRHYATNTSTTWLGSSRTSMPQKLCTSKGWMYCAEQGVAKMNAGKRSADKIHTAVVSLQSAPLELDPCTLVTGTTLLVNLYSIHNLYHFVKDNLATLMWTLHASGETGTDARILLTHRDWPAVDQMAKAGGMDQNCRSNCYGPYRFLPWLTAFSRHPIMTLPSTPSAVRFERLVAGMYPVVGNSGCAITLLRQKFQVGLGVRPCSGTAISAEGTLRLAPRITFIKRTKTSPARPGRVFLNLEAGITSVRAVLPSAAVETAEFEVLTMAQQWSLMARTDILIGSHGAGLSNSVFLPSCAQMLELVPKDIKGGLSFYADGIPGKGNKYLKISLPTTMKENITLPLALLADSARRMAASWRSCRVQAAGRQDVAPKKDRAGSKASRGTSKGTMKEGGGKRARNPADATQRRLRSAAFALLLIGLAMIGYGICA